MSEYARAASNVDTTLRDLSPAELLQRLKARGVTVRATKSRGLTIHGPVDLDLRLLMALRRRESEIVDHIRNPWADPAVAEKIALRDYSPRTRSAASGPLQADERWAIFEVELDVGPRLVEVVRSRAGRQYVHRLVADGHALVRLFMGGDLLPLPPDARRLDDLEAGVVRERILNTCPKCGSRARGRRKVCVETDVYRGEDALETAAELIRRTVANRGPLPWAKIVAELRPVGGPCAIDAAEALLRQARKSAGVVHVRGGGRGSGMGAGVWMVADLSPGGDLDAELARLLGEEGQG